jgi:hypothetical protein
MRKEPKMEGLMMIVIGLAILYVLVKVLLDGLDNR